MKRKQLTILSMAILSCISFGFTSCDKAEDDVTPEPEVCPEWSAGNCMVWNNVSDMTLQEEEHKLTWQAVYAGELTITEITTYDQSNLLATSETRYEYVREVAADSAWTNFWAKEYAGYAHREGNVLIRDNMPTHSDPDLKSYYTKSFFKSLYDSFLRDWNAHKGEPVDPMVN